MSSIQGVGIDLCDIGRMEKMTEHETFLARYFTEGERAYLRAKGATAAQSLAGLFAAKEAVCKALGTGIVFPLKDIEITHTAAGQPAAVLRGEALSRALGGEMLLSITHEGGMAAAVAIWVTPQPLPAEA